MKDKQGWKKSRQEEKGVTGEDGRSKAEKKGERVRARQRRGGSRARQNVDNK